MFAHARSIEDWVPLPGDGAHATTSERKHFALQMPLRIFALILCFVSMVGVPFPS